MSPPNPSSYNLRPRSKAVICTPNPNSPKISLTRQEQARRQRIIDQQAKLPFSEIEGVSEEEEEERRKYIRAYLDAKGIVRGPCIRVSDEERARVREKRRLRLAETGLSYLNQSSNSDAEYELVTLLEGRCFIAKRGRIHHFNFEAKLKNAPDAKPQLFFLEIVEKVPGAEKVTHCVSLGVSGSKAAATGPNGCQVCSLVNHPKKARFVAC
ncbi:hypothetical protein RND81_02G017300 [Saponaria officinalis]|uniref:DUF3615 domain-containing protein n=1 Tax=Saponaria officinalis TaxID=3572 RepID=A0AAW1MUH7_SAPOF